MIRAMLIGSLALGAAAVLAATDGSGRLGRALLSAGFPDLATRFMTEPAWRGVALYEDGRWELAAENFAASRVPGSAYNRGNALALSGRYAEAIRAYDLALAVDLEDSDARANRAIVAALMATDAAETGAGTGQTGAATEETSGMRRDDRADSDAQSTGDGMAGDNPTSASSEQAGGTNIERLPDAEQTIAQVEEGGARGVAADTEGAGETAGGMAEVADSGDGRRTRLPRPSDEARSVAPTVEWLATMSVDPGRFLRLRIAAEHARRQRQAARQGQEGIP